MLNAEIPKTPLHNWYPTKWSGETAWISTCDQYAAIVSEERARLVYFGTANFGQNFIATPHPTKRPSESDPWPDRGGHRFWLGPQKRWGWPPLPEWEYSRSKGANLEGSRLVLDMPHLNLAFPTIQKHYQWVGERFHCHCQWRNNDLPCYGMHVVAIHPIKTLELDLQVSDTAPKGYLAIERSGAISEERPTVKGIIGKSRAIVTSNSLHGEKLGFPIQPIELRVGEHTLVMECGEHLGEVAAEVDHAYRSQIWVRSPHPFNEIEQISPYLIAAKGQWVGHSIYLSAKQYKKRGGQLSK